MPLVLPVFIAAFVVVFLAAGAIAAACRCVTKSSALSITTGTLTLPMLTGASFMFWVLTMEVDDPAPGNVLMGNLIAMAVITPVALLASILTTRWLARRGAHKGS